MIADTLSQVGIEIMGSRAAGEYGGWTVDNTRTNHKAIGILAVRHPRCVNVGCFADGVALSMKPFLQVHRNQGQVQQ